MRAVVYAAHRARPAHLPGRPAPGAARVRRRGVLAPEPQAPLTTTLPPDSFDGRARLRDADGAGRRVSRSREPGSQATMPALATRVRSELLRGGFRVRDRRFEARTAAGRQRAAHGGRHPRGLSERRIVVVAHRDALDRPATRAAVRHGRPARAGAGIPRADAAQDARARLHERRQRRGRGRDRGGASTRATTSTPCSCSATWRATGCAARWSCRGPTATAWRPLALRRTVEGALRLEGGLRPGQAGAFAQFARLAFPFTTGRAGRVRGARLPPRCSCRPAGSAVPAPSAP